MDTKPKVLFLSRGNASRSKIAEGFLRALAGDDFLATSVGTEADGVSPLAVEVMNEVGIDISTQKAHSISSVFRENFHCVVTLCDEGRERYPLYPFTRKLLRWPVLDPETATEDSEEAKNAFRRVRDQLRERVEQFIQATRPKQTAIVRAHAAAA